MARGRIRFGAFLTPFHTPEENPGLALERDFELVEWMEKLGYDEVWFGEHHSGGWEINSSPELAIATAAQRTSRIRLGTGVSSVPYHHPFMLADRIRQLEYLTKGRVMFGLGPGSLPSDAHMLGIDTARVRDMLDEAIGPMVRLLKGETVTCKTDWFEMRDARLQLAPYCENGLDIAVANQVSPTGARAAGTFGLGMLSLGATTTGGFNALASNWAIAEDLAKDHGQTVDRSRWRLVGPIHVAETREQARANVEFGFHRWIDYFRHVAALPLAPSGVDPVQMMIDSGFAVVGTPDDAVQQLERLIDQSGGFGCFLKLGVNWADFAQTKRSYELFARYVIPKINNLNENRVASEAWLRENHAQFSGAMKSAVSARIDSHVAEKGAQYVAPGLQDALKS